MDKSVGLLIALVVGVLLVATFFVFFIPEPSGRAVIATERLDVAVLAFTNSSSWPGVGETLEGRIETKLVNAQGIDVYSRAQLDALLIEHALSEAGFIDPKTAVEIGSLTGVSKLVTGSVYAVDTGARDTQVCVVWEDGNCVDETPATEYSARIRAQIEVVDARSGLIERSLDLQASDSTTLREGSLFGGFDSLLASAATSIAGDVQSALTAAYTRELRYGLYRSVEVKRGGYIGEGETSRFSQTDDAVHLIVHFTRIEERDVFDVAWVDSDNVPVARMEDVVSRGEWRHYRLDPSSLEPGRYRAHGILNGIDAFDEPFTISP
jgi:curli biogenesis system outer membrane secretion channel CsgG